MKNCLATLGLLLLLLLGVAAVFLLIAFARENQADLEQAARELGIQLPTALPAVLTPFVDPGTRIERTNPLENATPPPAPTNPPQPTPTPIPDPTAYRTEVLIRARQFAATLESFIELNEELQSNPGLLNDTTWRAETKTTLDLLVEAAWALSSAGPVPAEYQQVQGWLGLVGPEAQSLRDNYIQGIQSGNVHYFHAAGESLVEISQQMAQAQQAMVAAGWEQ